MLLFRLQAPRACPPCPFVAGPHIVAMAGASKDEGMERKPNLWSCGATKEVYPNALQGQPLGQLIDAVLRKRSQSGNGLGVLQQDNGQGQMLGSEIWNFLFDSSFMVLLHFGNFF